MKKLILVVGLILLAAIALTLFAQRPARNVSAERHPHIAAAQRSLSQAAEQIDVAQRSNEFDMGGHAQKAKELIVQASNELKLAAEADNARRGK